jgi:hypothetical protein
MSGMDRTLAGVASSGSGTIVDRSTYEMIANEVKEIHEEFPSMLPTLRREDFFAHDVGRGPPSASFLDLEIVCEQLLNLLGLVGRVRKRRGYSKTATETRNSPR